MNKQGKKQIHDESKKFHIRWMQHRFALTTNNNTGGLLNEWIGGWDVKGLDGYLRVVLGIEHFTVLIKLQSQRL